MRNFLIDGFAYARHQEHREGEVAVAKLSRLADESVDGCGMLHWEVVGGTHALGHAQLAISIIGAIQIMCQRCLTPLTVEVNTHTVLVLARDEKEADEINTLFEAHEEIDVIVGTESMDLMMLIEDEALLALPLSPRHTVCSDLAVSALSQKPVSPFAILKKPS